MARSRHPESPREPGYGLPLPSAERRTFAHVPLFQATVIRQRTKGFRGNVGVQAFTLPLARTVLQPDAGYTGLMPLAKHARAFKPYPWDK